ncbi:MAG: hypothetical protein MUF15_27270 [Acidobacteria bacterium]|nr:hypothetical protein [Acidobacteriota bacterium]
MKKLIFCSLCLIFGLGGLVFADEPIGVFANSNTNSIQFINPATQGVSDSLLKGHLGNYSGTLLDVVITSDGKTAIVSNFGDATLFFINISGGFDVTPPLLTNRDSRRIPIFAEDMAITPDDNYVLITDGGFTPTIVVVEIKTRKVLSSKNFNAYSNAIAISPDGRTVLTADYFLGKINLFNLNRDGTLTYVKSQNVLPARPVNVSISPDGKTAIGVSATSHYAPVFALGTGTMVFSGFIALPHQAGQSCVFNREGTKAYYLTNSINHRIMIDVLDVMGPGQVVYSGTSITGRPKKGTSQLFGVDSIAIDPSDNYLYVTNPSLSGGATRISVIDLTANAQVNYIEANGIPAGIAFATIKK